MSTLVNKSTVIIALALALLLLGVAPLFGLQKTPRPKSDKAADSTKAKPAVVAPKPLTPAMTRSADSVKKIAPTPGKFNDFRDANKNGIDDRLEKKPETRKSQPEKTKTKPAEKKTTEKQATQKKSEPSKSAPAKTITKTSKSK